MAILSHSPRLQPRRANADTCQACTADIDNSLAAQGSGLIEPYAKILKMLNVVTASALLHWHRAQPGVFLSVPPKTGGRDSKPRFYAEV
ncbi:hypothetical protein, partial [Stenotrophomonas maltophilia]|uniref:hypothetical protein n=1 Tax=Stenotrophomonas maltophilia TaxID=40324 RepID=UPI001C401173